MASRFIAPVFDTGNGISPSDGAELFFFETGTSTPKSTFTTSAATIANTNPVVADSDGVFPDIFITGSYKVVLKDKNGVQTGFGEKDPVVEGLTTIDGTIFKATVADMKTDIGISAGQIIFTSEHTTGFGFVGGNKYLARLVTGATDDNGEVIKSTGNTAIEFLGLFPSGLRYPQQWGAAANGSTVDNVAFQAALDALGTVGGTLELVGDYALTTTQVPATNSNGLILNGDSLRGTVLRWTGGASKIIELTSDLDNCEIRNVTLQNDGTATVGVSILNQRFLGYKIFCNSNVAFSTAILQTDTASTTTKITFEECDLFSSQASQAQIIGIDANGGHTVNVKNCMFSGIGKGVRAGNASTISALNVSGSRFESFSGDSAPFPGTPTDIGIDVVNVRGLDVGGCSFEMASDQQVSSAPQRAITLRTVAGGNIHGNDFLGQGAATASIEVADAAALGIVVSGNNFHRINGNGVEQSGTGLVANIEIALNNAVSPTTSAADLSWTPIIKIGGSETGITYSNQLGVFARRDNYLFYEGTFTLSSKGAETGQVRVSGFPAVTAASAGPNIIGAATSNLGTPDNSLATLAPANGTAEFRLILDSGNEVTEADITNTSSFTFSGYFKLAQ